ncbi:helix-turn-helix domain-containing protein [Holdemanella porci]|uniref:helix-turn-helix domain-containing protein n=1 Tax=Holdemanella porci TaxID=2652276 RepID=UPI003AAAE438
MEEQQKAYYAIIPANVRYDKDLVPSAKLLYGEITALCNEKGYCWATNQYFAELYNVSDRTIKNWISQLTDKGYIQRSAKYREGTKEIEQRKLFIGRENNFTTSGNYFPDPRENNFTTPSENNFPVNNTSINNTFNNTNIYKGEKKRKSETVNSVIAEYTESKDLQDALHGFVEMRNKARKPLTARAMKLSLNKLNELALDDVTKIAIVNQSIVHSWSTFYKLQNNNGPKQLTRKEMGYAF